MDPTPGQRDLAAFYGRNATFGSTERYRTACLAESYDLGLQYSSRPPATAPGAIRTKQPRVQVPLFAEAIDALNGFVWGGHRFPDALVAATREADDADDADEVGPRLTVDDAALLTRFVAAMARAGRLDRLAREMARSALVTTSCAVLLGAQGGYLQGHVEPGKHCTPTFDPFEPRRLASLEILYQHQVEEPNGTGGVRKQWYWYRRTLDTTGDTVYIEVPVRAGQAPKWTVDASKTVEHGLGFCPAVWVRTLPTSADPIDGRPVIAPTLYPLLEAVDYTLSQRDRAVSYGCDPQTIRKGVDEDDRAALEKNPGKVWDIGADASVEFAEIHGDGIVRANEHVDDLTARFHAAVRVVLMDPKALGGDISGRVLEIVHQPMITVASDLRADLGDAGYSDVLALGLRIVATLTARGEDVWIQGAKKAATVLLAAQLAGPWIDPPIALAWPEFFAPSVAEQQTLVATAAAAEDSGLITRATATRAVAAVFHVDDPDAEAAAVEEERSKAREQLQSVMGAGQHDAAGPSPFGVPETPAGERDTKPAEDA